MKRRVRVVRWVVEGHKKEKERKKELRPKAWVKERNGPARSSTRRRIWLSWERGADGGARQRLL